MDEDDRRDEDSIFRWRGKGRRALVVGAVFLAAFAAYGLIVLVGAR